MPAGHALHGAAGPAALTGERPQRSSGAATPVTATRRYDAVVIGAGPNGLVAANRLADAGWSVLVLEAQPEVGGAVTQRPRGAPGFVHDTFSAFYPLAAASPTIRRSGSSGTG